jgi:uncharacterized protein with HEPN domain
MPSLCDRESLLDITRATRKILQYKAQTTELKFAEDEHAQAAIRFQLMVLHSAILLLSGDLRTQHPEVPWSLVTKLRDTLSHGQDDLSLEAVWQLVQADVPALQTVLQPLVLQ